MAFLFVSRAKLRCLFDFQIVDGFPNINEMLQNAEQPNLPSFYGRTKQQRYRKLEISSTQETIGRNMYCVFQTIKRKQSKNEL